MKVFPHQLMERSVHAVESEPNVSCVVYNPEKYSFANHDMQNIKRLLSDNGAKAFCPVAKEGSFKALWDLAEDLCCGIEVFLEDIPISAETIEISEYFDINPYRMDSKGAFVYYTQEDCDEKIQKALYEIGIKPKPIGDITDNADRIVRYDNNIHYLTPRGE